MRTSSRNVRGFLYRQRERILEITIKDGSVYQYFNVPEKIVNELKNTDNPDSFYEYEIKTRFRRLFKSYDYSL